MNGPPEISVFAINDALRTFRVWAAKALCITLLLLSATTAGAEVSLGTAMIRNSSVYSSAELFAIYQPYLGQAVTGETARNIAEALRNRYLADGYSRPGFRIDDDGRQSGIVRIDLIEPSISGVRINGKSGPHGDALQTLFSDLPSEHSLRPGDIRDIVGQARRLPGLDVNISTRPDEQVPGGYVLEVDSNYRALSGSATYTNRGTKQIGRNLLFARLESNGMFGGDNVLGLFLASATNRNDYASGGLFLRSALGDGRTTLFLQGSLADLQIVSSGVLVDQDRQRYTARVARRMPDWGKRQVTLRGGFEVDDLDVYFDGEVAREDRIRSVESALTLTWRDGSRQHLLTAEAELGLGALGARLDNFDDPGDRRRADYTILRAHYADLFALDRRWSLRFDGYAQYSPHRLPSIRQFKVGGGRIGRGFDAAALRGDRGLGAKAELRRVLHSGGWLDRLDGYAFYDIGAAWDTGPGERESAASAGVGLSLRGDALTGYFELAQPLTHADADGDKDLGLFVELTGRF